MNSFLNGSLVLVCTLALLALLAAIAPQTAIYVCLLLAIYAVIALARPFRPAWLGGRLVSAVLFVLATLSFVTAMEINHFRLVELAAQNEARLQALRSSDPKAYLGVLRSTGDSRWESELQTLDKPSYDVLIAERYRAKEIARKEQIAYLVAQLSKTQPADLESLRDLYVSLSALDPQNSDYKKNRDSLAKQIIDANAKRYVETQELEHPENYVSIEAFSWTKEGFGNVMEASFVIKNKLPWPVKDVEILCKHSAPSGTFIDSNTRTIYQRFEANQTKRINKFSMGFIHSQVTSSNCRIISVVSIR